MTRRRIRPRFFVFLALLAGVGIGGYSLLSRPIPSVAQHVDPPAARAALKPPSSFYTLTPFGLPEGLSNFSAISTTGGIILVAGGQIPGGINSTTYTLTSNGAVISGSLNQPRQDGGLALIHGNPVYFGGVTSAHQIVSTAQSLNGSSPYNFLPQALYGFAAATANNITYVVGGITPIGYSANIYRINPQGQATLWSTLPMPIAHPMAQIFRGSLYIAGGATASGKLVPTIFRVSLQTKQLSRWAEMPVGLDNGSMAVLDNRIWILGGATRNGLSRATWVIMGKNAVVPARPLPEPLSGASVVSANNAIWIMGGHSPQGLSSTIYILKSSP